MAARPDVPGAAASRVPDEAAPRIPPFRGNVLGEARVQLELAALLGSQVHRGVGVPHGDGAPVVLVPGFGAGDVSLAVLRAWLRRIGHRTYRSGIAWNVDCSEAAVRRLDRRVSDVAERSGRPVALIGHSRGGLLAHAVAVRRPSRVRAVITLGSPLSSPFDASVLTLAAVGWARLGQSLWRPARPQCLTTSCPCAFGADLRRVGPVPLTSIRTSEDGIVRPESCVAPAGGGPGSGADPGAVSNVVVRGSHLGLCVNAAVYREIAHAL
ncbi:esterase/lipase family protein [Actinomycetospora sp.]|uniref:esterase/lipase family protein n=1 Tax=Actinomycetospora sp. TaxID=1872135 RepID=UPI002F422366